VQLRPVVAIASKSLEAPRGHDRQRLFVRNPQPRCHLLTKNAISCVPPVPSALQPFKLSSSTQKPGERVRVVCSSTGAVPRAGTTDLLYTVMSMCSLGMRGPSRATACGRPAAAVRTLAAPASAPSQTSSPTLQLEKDRRQQAKRLKDCGKALSKISKKVRSLACS
jgi:hypothetical protein